MLPSGSDGAWGYVAAAPEWTIAGNRHVVELHGRRAESKAELLQSEAVWRPADEFDPSSKQVGRFAPRITTGIRTRLAHCDPRWWMKKISTLRLDIQLLPFVPRPNTLCPRGSSLGPRRACLLGSMGTAAPSPGAEAVAEAAVDSISPTPPPDSFRSGLDDGL
ncbi:hypothetical protein PaG_04441 [Moesziomyces aphidis]|uniref:Uncharacterized protein n=1 Tax=Moesziomyces aphidis TaxID=84754 RepID=W3VKY5_MOEAP|nr:hypothetical protein PaG_04441 [Moesziomyces aphidis]